MQTFGYKPALDGLRALAVLPVLAYHADLEIASGGFLGVDLFFVLSGYLITSLLVTEQGTHGRLDLPAFWMRRARRLLPALFVTLIITSLYAVFLAALEEIWRIRSDEQKHAFPYTMRPHWKVWFLRAGLQEPIRC